MSVSVCVYVNVVEYTGTRAMRQELYSHGLALQNFGDSLNIEKYNRQPNSLRQAECSFHMLS